jgi:hypothetical protein
MFREPGRRDHSHQFFRMTDLIIQIQTSPPFPAYSQIDYFSEFFWITDNHIRIVFSDVASWRNAIE